MDTKTTAGRPRSQEARTAVLYAVDDLLVEVGYAAMSMKTIAERAGVSRQTVYKWWNTKAEILLEASAEDAEGELLIHPEETAEATLTAFLRALMQFLTVSHAGIAYRALLGEAQHDSQVAGLLRTLDPVHESARRLLQLLFGEGMGVPLQQAVAVLVGPVVYWAMKGQPQESLSLETIVSGFLSQVQL